MGASLLAVAKSIYYELLQITALKRHQCNVLLGKNSPSSIVAISSIYVHLFIKALARSPLRHLLLRIHPRLLKTHDWD